MTIKVVGAGLAGAEAAYYLAERGFKVELYDIKPRSFTPAHKSGNFGELVCSNSLKGRDAYSNACGLLKQEMRILGSLTMDAAAYAEIPAGGALAVDREKFASFITQKLISHPNIEVKCEEIKAVPKPPCIIATGPLTCDNLAEDIRKKFGGALHFYDASAPIISRESVDLSRAFFGDRYGKGGDDYLNCPLSKEEYERFVYELVNAERAVLHEFEKREIFEGCMPVEVMAARGAETLRFGPFKPVGLRDKDGNKFYAVLQLRKETADGGAYNLVGCQTNLKFSEQKRVFSLIPALKEAEFLRYGVMHRNTYLNSPKILNADFSVKGEPLLFFTGQLTGVEGYVESAASGLLAAVHMARKAENKPVIIPDQTTVLGALSAHISGVTDNFQPMNANFGILKPLEKTVRDKKQRYALLADRALKNIEEFVKKICE
ncbi:MAG: methylenetetrahydrofolate--tRNA-(uracil(54)-C(5))-methyltransferase (FADH(2)-oxidizing) TrmFO [Clostridiales bacterium]|nr:methylenetetrahydrofolate--tRNA-(uracil(54)-C(5))-methyltransferase (FADH(2)-oxidizing) TrmFO [Clostridiales bacterium]